MFKKNGQTQAPTSFEKIDTLIGKNTNFTGTLNAQGTLRIDGCFEGDIIANGDIIVGESGSVKGNVSAVNIFICGVVNGNIGASGQLRLAETSKLYGDVEVATFVIDEGAIFEGKTKMGSTKKKEEPVVPASTAKPAK
jgi:cytoskeletal protein CcmA (bactofilin family)